MELFIILIIVQLFADEASGSSMDWVKGVLRTPYVFGMELRPTLDKTQGFITTSDQIKPSAREVWRGMKSVALSIESEV